MAKRILITDDALFMRVTLKNILVQNGYEVVGEAANGAESVELYKQLRPDVVTMDIDPTLRPGVIGSVFEMPFADGAFDAAACFQMLEHLPFERFVPALTEMRRVARVGMALSLPDCSYALTVRMGVRNPRKDGWVRAWTLQPSGVALRKFKKVPNSAGHYWEIGRRGTPLAVVRDAIRRSGWRVENEFRTAENAYHRFFVLK